MNHYHQRIINHDLTIDPINAILYVYVYLYNFII